jgi:hypothetical protein
MQIDQVLEEYRQGDADKRLSLFLYYRELRDEFACIEQDEPADLSAAYYAPEPIRQSMVKKVLFLLRNRSRWFRPRESMDRVVP